MKPRWFVTHLFVGIFIFLASCTSPTPTSAPPTAAPTLASTETLSPTEAPTVAPVEPTDVPDPEEQPIYLAIIWHQHQPVYFKDPETGVYVRPWVRVHATKDYVDMVSILENYPDVHVTFNLTPSLIRQLDDLEAGAKDLYWVYAEVPADSLTEGQKQFLLDRFFDTNRRIIARFPRYQELLEKRDNSSDPMSEYSVEDFRDLQILFNLAWTDPDWLANEPLAALVEKGSEFLEADKQILFEQHVELIARSVPIHREFQDAGQIEVTMTPFAHPILPLLVTTDLARKALPEINLPSQQFIFGQDAQEQVSLGVELYEDHFGLPPRGMWPAEGSVAQEIVTMVSRNGIQWMATDEGVLANSLGFDSFTRDAREVVVEADQLYRPYFVQGTRGNPVAIVFRDVLLSDKVGFTYSGLEGSLAAEDFINRIHAIRDKLVESGAEGPHLVSVILDGENAWEHYENDGKEFLNSLYQRLSGDPLIKTVTPSEFLEIAPDQPTIEDLWAGSWISHDFSTWIGEDEENRAWELLAETRAYLQTFITGRGQGTVSEEALAEAITQMYIAEGSDWFWWYGADQNSGNDEIFDLQYRETLKQVYVALGEEPPAFLDVPIIPEKAVTASRAATGLISPTIDGVLAAGEWDAGGLYAASGGVMAAGQPYFDGMIYGFDTKNLYLAFTAQPDFVYPPEVNNLEIYLSVPGSGETNSFSRGGSLLGFPANRLVEVQLEGGELNNAQLYLASGDEKWVLDSVLDAAAFGESVGELGIPLAGLGNADSGDPISMRAFFNEDVEVSGVANLVDNDRVPGTGPAVVAVPDLGTSTVVVGVMDPADDDHGPGDYAYPSDGVFTSGSYDILTFQVSHDDENVIFKFTMDGPVNNVWDSPNGLSIQTFDVYLDTDGDDVGGRAMLPGRNLALRTGLAWDFAITAEGWTSGIFVPGEEGPQRIAEASEIIVLADPGQQKVTIRVSKSILGDNPEEWGYAAAVMSQEGFPSGGVMRVRDVLPVAEQWRIGGAPQGSTNHTRVMDLVWPVEGEQEAWLSDFAPVGELQTELTVDDFATVPLLSAGE